MDTFQMGKNGKQWNEDKKDLKTVTLGKYPIQWNYNVTTSTRHKLNPFNAI